VLSRAELIERVWEQQVSGRNVVDAAIKSLRKKLGRDSACLETVIGHGYRFVGFRTS
jgi:DNA-binding winged helix-turn-helix (wHTH) protein